MVDDVQVGTIKYNIEVTAELVKCNIRLSQSFVSYRYFVYPVRISEKYRYVPRVRVPKTSGMVNGDDFLEVYVQSLYLNSGCYAIDCIRNHPKSLLRHFVQWLVASRISSSNLCVWNF